MKHPLGKYFNGSTLLSKKNQLNIKLQKNEKNTFIMLNRNLIYI